MNEPLNQMHLHSENFDLCRVCLLEPESNREIKFYHVFSPQQESLMLHEKIYEFLGLRIEKEDVKPKIICHNCYTSVMSWVEMKRKAHESQVVVNYIEKKRYNRAHATPRLLALPESNLATSSSNTNPSTHSRNNSFYSISTISNTSNLNVQNNISSTTTEDNQSESDDDTACQVVTTVGDDVIYISDSESNDESIEYNINDDKLKIIYCSICKKQKNYDHDCSQSNKEFSTCLVPNCNIISRSIRDFTPHYRLHIGMPAGAVLCRCCYKENKKSERDENGRHTNNCFTVSLFKCYTCNMNFKNMPAFAFHKLKTHNARLINSSGNYLCYYCEKSSPNLMIINDHIKQCRKNRAVASSTITRIDAQPKEAEKKILIGKHYGKNITEGNIVKLPRSAKQVLFTCLKPSCNLIFQNFAVFKFHHREHFDIDGEFLICWQCCSTFTNLTSLRAHQAKANCRIPGMFKCQCSEKFNDIESLSIHKYLFHNGDLISNKNNRRTIICTYCKEAVNVSGFKPHLLNCYTNKDKKVIRKPIKDSHNKTVIKKGRCPPFKCEFCGKVCLTSAALSSHIKIHSTPTKRNSTQVKRKFDELTNTSENYQSTSSNIEKTDVEMNVLSRTSLSNGNIVSNDYDITNTSSIEDTDGKLHSTSRTSIKNEFCSSIGDNIPLSVEELHPCSQCPKKFSSNKGLLIHLNSHSGFKGTPKAVPQNYYCTKCKEYFSRSGFSDHWKSSHGRRLPYHKHKRFNCTKCQRKFMYKIALLMHKELEHNKPENPANVKTNKPRPQIVLPQIYSAMTLDSKKDKNPVENDQKNCNEKENTLLEIKTGELENEIKLIKKQDNKVNECKNNEVQDNEVNDSKNNKGHDSEVNDDKTNEEQGNECINNKEHGNEVNEDKKNEEEPGNKVNECTNNEVQDNKVNECTNNEVSECTNNEEQSNKVNECTNNEEQDNEVNKEKKNEEEPGNKVNECTNNEVNECTNNKEQDNEVNECTNNEEQDNEVNECTNNEEQDNEVNECTNNGEQNNEVSECTNNEEQKFSNTNDNNIDDIHKKIKEIVNQVKKADDEVFEGKLCSENTKEVDSAGGNEVNRLLIECKTAVDNNEKNINSVVEESLDCLNEIIVEKENQISNPKQ